MTRCLKTSFHPLPTFDPPCSQPNHQGGRSTTARCWRIAWTVGCHPDDWGLATQNSSKKSETVSQNRKDWNLFTRHVTCIMILSLMDVYCLYFEFALLWQVFKCLAWWGDGWNYGFIDISGLELLWCLLWTCTKTAYHERIAAGLDFEWTYAFRNVGGCDSSSIQFEQDVEIYKNLRFRSSLLIFTVHHAGSATPQAVSLAW